MKELKPHLAALAINIAALIFLYSQTRYIDADQRYAQLAEINDLKILSLLLDRDVFRLNFNQLANYDSIVDGQRRRNQVIDDLAANGDAARIVEMIPMDLVASAKAMAVQTDQAIDLIKRTHSQLKNSQSYFPVLVDDLNARLESVPLSPGIVRALSRLRDLIAIHSSTQSIESRIAVDRHVQALQTTYRPKFATDLGLIDDFDHVLEHAKIIAIQVVRLRHLVDQYLSFEFHGIANQLYDWYSRSFAEEQKRSQSLFPMFYGVQIVLLGQVLFLFVQLIRANQQVVEQAQALQQRLDKERQLSGLQRQFVSMVSHEFRTPLAIIDGNAQRMQRRADKITPIQLETMTAKMRTSVLRLTDLMESVLSVSKLEEGRIDFKPTSFNLIGLLNEVANNYREVHLNRTIRIQADDLPARFDGDAKLLRQVFSNLISNAIKYSATGSPVSVVGRLDRDDVVIAIQDEGVGIPPEEIQRLFERFFRASTSTGIAGTGIGLHLVKHLVDLHDGRIEVSSVPGIGSSFIIYLPIRPGQVASREPCVPCVVSVGPAKAALAVDA